MRYLRLRWRNDGHIVNTPQHVVRGVLVRRGWRLVRGLCRRVGTGTIGRVPVDRHRESERRLPKRDILLLKPLEDTSQVLVLYRGTIRLAFKLSQLVFKLRVNDVTL